MWSFANKPEYWYQPARTLRRLWQYLGPPAAGYAEIDLLWGAPLRIRPQEVIGASLWRMGLYDLPVSEAIWRLLDPGELALDVGANIGYMTSLMAARAGPAGQVLAFEPHPGLFVELQHQLAAWARLPRMAPVKAHQVGLSDAPGQGRLQIPRDFDANMGQASLLSEGALADNETRYILVELARLDDVLAEGEAIGLAKIDVEGHEAAVLRGAARLLRGHTIRDLVFEDHGAWPTPVMELLVAHGYEIFRLDLRFTGPRLLPPTAGPSRAWDPPSYLASADPERARARLAKPGWQILRGQGR